MACTGPGQRDGACVELVGGGVLAAASAASASASGAAGAWAPVQHPLHLGGRVGRLAVARLAVHRQQALVAEAQDRDAERRRLDTVALAQPLDGRQGARIVAARDEHELRRVAGHDGLERVGDGGEAGGVPAGDVGGGGQRTADLPLDGLARDVQDHGAAGLLVERQQIDAGSRLGRDEAKVGKAAARARKRARKRRSAPAAPRGQGCSP